MACGISELLTWTVACSNDSPLWSLVLRNSAEAFSSCGYAQGKLSASWGSNYLLRRSAAGAIDATQLRNTITMLITWRPHNTGQMQPMKTRLQTRTESRSSDTLNPSYRIRAGLPGPAYWHASMPDIQLDERTGPGEQKQVCTAGKFDNNW